MARTAIYRGQRFHVVDENNRFVTLEGFGYKKKVQLEEVIFEEEPVDNLPAEHKSEELLKEPAIEDMPAEHKDNDILTKEQIDSVMKPHKKAIRVAYELWSPEDVEAGDTDDKGWENEEGFEMEAEEDISSVDKAIKFLKDHGPVEASSTEFHPGVWYSTTDGQKDFKTGNVKMLSFHLVGFDDEEEKQIFDGLKKNKLRERISKFVVPPRAESASTPAPTVSEKLNPDYPKFGLDLSVDTAEQRHKENEERRKKYVSDMKMALKEMMDKLDEMEMPQVSTDPSCDMCHDEVEKIEEDGSAPASAGGGVADAHGVVDTALAGSGGVSTKNVANFNARMNIGLNTKEREKEKFKNANE